MSLAVRSRIVLRDKRNRSFIVKLQPGQKLLHFYHHCFAFVNNSCICLQNRIQCLCFVFGNKHYPERPLCQHTAETAFPLADRQRFIPVHCN